MCGRGVSDEGRGVMRGEAEEVVIRGVGRGRARERKVVMREERGRV